MNCILLPIHSKKINWLYGFIKSINLESLKKFDLVLLVSNQKEKVQIITALSAILKEYLPHIQFFNVDLFLKNTLNNDQIYQRYIKNEDKCIVNLKKFVGLYWAKDLYDYCAVIDCDTIFKNQVDSLNIFDNLIQNYNKNIYFGGVSKNPIIRSILEGCAEFFKDNGLDHEKLKSATEDFTIYPWFFDIPFYEKNDLQDFFAFMAKDGSLKEFWLKQNWHSFEHIIFIYYRYIHKNSKLINYSNDVNTSIPENLSFNDLEYLKYKYDYMPCWARFSHVLGQPQVIENEGVNMLYHVDRV